MRTFKKIQKLKFSGKISKPIASAISFLPEQDCRRQIKLNKTTELRVRRFIRQLTGAPIWCKIYPSYTPDKEDFKKFYAANHSTWPEYLGDAGHWTFPDFKSMPEPKWFIINGRRTHQPWPIPKYKVSTRRIEIGTDILNKFKILIKKQHKSQYKLEIDDRIISLPNLELGRFVIKNYDNRSKIKIIKNEKY